ncbi:MAG: Snf7 family protein [Candidatus Bathyarchaeota archaeon]|nr:Snf7 family protein [Candidatus Bathyarchaeota archaeon]
MKEKGSKILFTTKIKEAIKPSGQLKQRLNVAVRRIRSKIQSMDKALERFSKRDKAIFRRIVKLYSTHDTLRASVLANELAEIRKVEKMLMQAKLALESISLRLKTVSELGDIVTVLTPAVSVLNNIKSSITDIVPEADKELGDVGKLLTEIVSSTSQTTGLPVNFEAANEEAAKILEEAASVAEQRIKKKLPELPAEASVKEKVKLKT